MFFFYTTWHERKREKLSFSCQSNRQRWAGGCHCRDDTVSSSSSGFKKNFKVLKKKNYLFKPLFEILNYTIAGQQKRQNVKSKREIYLVLLLRRTNDEHLDKSAAHFCNLFGGDFFSQRKKLWITADYYDQEFLWVQRGGRVLNYSAIFTQSLLIKVNCCLLGCLFAKIWRTEGNLLKTGMNDYCWCYITLFWSGENFEHSWRG